MLNDAHLIFREFGRRPLRPDRSRAVEELVGAVGFRRVPPQVRKSVVGRVSVVVAAHVALRASTSKRQEHKPVHADRPVGAVIGQRNVFPALSVGVLTEDLALVSVTPTVGVINDPVD